MDSYVAKFQVALWPCGNNAARFNSLLLVDLAGGVRPYELHCVLIAKITNGLRVGVVLVVVRAREDVYIQLFR